MMSNQVVWHKRARKCKERDIIDRVSWLLYIVTSVDVLFFISATTVLMSSSPHLQALPFGVTANCVCINDYFILVHLMYYVYQFEINYYYYYIKNKTSATICFYRLDVRNHALNILSEVCCVAKSKSSVTFII